MKATAIIVNYNTRKLLRRALASLPAGLDAIVVDNGSDDGSVELVRREFPSVRLLANPTNVGFAAAVNQAAREVREGALLLLNSDAVMEPGALEALEARLAAEPKAAAVGARLSGEHDRLQPSTYPPLSLPLDLLATLRAWHWLPKRVAADRLLGSYWDHAAARPVGRISGTCLLVSPEAWKKIGPLSEDFFVYGEIHDWCERARKRGWEIWFEPAARARHGVAVTAKALWPENERVLRIWDAHYRLLRRHQGRWLTWLHALNYLVSNAMAWLKIALFGAPEAYRERLGAEMGAHLAALSPSVLGPPGGPMTTLLVQGTQRLVAIVGMKAISLITTMAMARTLGRGRLGVATLVISLADVASLAAGQSLPSAVAKQLSDPRDKADRGRILGCATAAIAASSLLVAAPFFLIPVPLAQLYGAPDMAIYLRVGGLMMLGGLGTGYLLSWFQGFDEIGRMSKLQVVQSLITAAATLAWIPLQTPGTLLAALTAANGVSLLYFAWEARGLLRRHHVRLSVGGEAVWGKVLGFSVPATLAAFASWPQFWAASTVLKMRSTFGAVGLFAVAMQLPRNIIVFSQALAAPYVPMISRLHGEGRHGGLVARVQRGMAAMVFPPSLLFALLALPLLRLLYGRDFDFAWPSVILLSAAWYLKSINDAITHYLLGAGRLWASLAYNLATLAALVAGCWWLCRPYAAFGAAAGFFFGYALYHGLAMASLRRELGVGLKDALRLLAAPMALFGACFWITPRIATPAGGAAAALAMLAGAAWSVELLTAKPADTPLRFDKETAA